MPLFSHFQDLILTADQKAALEQLSGFLGSNKQVFMLKGYAGSGKTTILKGLTNYLEDSEKEYVLMASTGRAAKVIREKTDKEAFTIHKSIYSFELLKETKDENSFIYYYKIRQSDDVTNNIFLVDESSMISDELNEGEFFRFGSGHLLSDLFTYSRVGNEAVNSKIIFIGDPCQLPPVKDKHSRAFDKEYLKERFGVAIAEAEMKEIIRNEKGSGIIKVAENLRRNITAGYFNNFNLSDNGKDIFNPAYHSFLSKWRKVTETKIIIAYKNKTCQDINKEIRYLKYGEYDLPIRKEDQIIVGGNNYKKDIFNGEFGIISKASEQTESRKVSFYLKKEKNENKAKTVTVRLTWRYVELLIPSENKDKREKIVKGKILENFLYGDNRLSSEEMRALYIDFKNRHRNLKQGTEAFKEAIQNDAYFNCILLKYGYAVTCHKAQGGEWENAFILWDYGNSKFFNFYEDVQTITGKINEDFFRWAYTAITRSSKNVFALNPPKFTAYSNIIIFDEEVKNALNQLTSKETTPAETPLTDELLTILKELDIYQESIPIQDHFITVLEKVRTKYIQIVNWEKKNFEIWYYFGREGEKTAFKTWIKGNGQFNGSRFQVIDKLESNKEFSKEVRELLNHLPELYVKRETVDTIPEKVLFELKIEEKFPFTKTLFNDLEKLLSETEIFIEQIEHLNYRERYTFVKGNKKVKIDFGYNNSGFFGRVEPLNVAGSDSKLLAETFSKVELLKEENYAK